jgi:hypothetical protein
MLKPQVDIRGLIEHLLDQARVAWVVLDQKDTDWPALTL